MKLSLILLLLVLWIANPLAAHEILKPVRAAAPPRIDGVLDDAVWNEAREVSGFKTFIPDFAKDLSERTSAWMAYDADNLYFAFRCHDRDPERIKASLAARDTMMNDDFVCINLDSFNDQQALYAFYVNPLGIQGDSRFAGNNEDFSADFVWSSAGRLTPDGYAVELRIPFKSIRYAGRERVEMAIFFERYISRTTEHGSVPELDPAKGYAFLSQMQPLELRDVRRSTLLEALPSLVYDLKHEQEAGSLRRTASRGEIGFTGKWGLTSRLVLDFAWNPDFSQVESDAGQVDANLRSDLYYSEKRPFFLEGSDIFQTAGMSFFQSAVHTRRIVDPLLGLKLSGKLGRKDTLAAVFAIDEVGDDPLHADSGAENAAFAILRYKRALSGDGFLGAFYTGREQGSDFNRLLGLDGQIRLSRSETLSFHGFASFTDNPSMEDEQGAALNAYYSKSTRDVDLMGCFYSIGRGFFSESGFLSRGGLTGIESQFGPKLYPKSSFFRKVQPRLFGTVIRDHESGMSEAMGKLGVDLLLPGNASLTLEGWAASEIFLGRRFDTSQYRLIANSWLSKKLYLYLGFRRGNQVRYAQEPFQGTGNSFACLCRYLPTNRLEWEFRLSYADLFAKADGSKAYDYTIVRNKFTYQLNKYLFFRGVLEYNDYYRKLLSDLLVSFTYIPGTVLQLGYGSLYEKYRWEENDYRPDDRFLEMKRGLFFKASYLWRLQKLQRLISKIL
ncbi:MAG: carbohydrate binding family 9 domain-containing protein [Candidatus Aminicenantes bacterium]|nr:carbohydrate binding family 9 domain-containing protein [Candidatus Aminicenantes bacterium]